MRAVFDPNVLISALLAPRGTPARLLAMWADGAFELVVSPLLLAELDRALGYPKLRKRIPADDAAAVLEWLRRSAGIHDDPAADLPFSSPDPGDDYLLALASNTRAALVSGDRHLLSLEAALPVYSPAAFLAILERSGDR